ncbi:glycosyltransferase family 2 protein [Alcanivorax sp.]|jgi:glycosyltransferase involved in cell wall biosynthesis|uniref:glycosyltransferase family 2 protein n=1 Tax=Alcanivorax sp. TaxID=1872427 RepID=UPI0032D8EEC3
MVVEYLRNGDLVPKPPKPRKEGEITAQWAGSFDKPLASIICITYNHALYIEDALNGFLMQETIFPFEIWVHDDASTDETQKIVERYRKEYPNIIKTVFQDENQYCKGNRPLQYIKDLIKGKYCALCEGDDYWLGASKLDQQVSFLERHTDIYLSVHSAYVLNVSKRKLHKGFEHEPKNGEILPVSDAISSTKQFAPTASYVFRADKFKLMPFWFFYAQDLPFGDYFIEAILGRNGINYVSAAHSVYRRNVPGSYTRRTEEASDDYLFLRMLSALKYTAKIGDFKQITQSAIQLRRKNIVIDYQTMALLRNSMTLYKSIVNAEPEPSKLGGFFIDFAFYNNWSFQLYRISKLLILISKRGFLFLRNKTIKYIHSCPKQAILTGKDHHD